ncbi:MAG: hypothetical protein L6R37_008118 [Teloschistes peruensis]|nr:MAG: hypothetical protein L6R37_008118 [Teloschistes peruensis]
MDLKATALLKLIYLEMFGHDMSWASFHVLEVMSSSKYLQKRAGYLGAVQSFRPDTEVLMLATNLLKKDITSPSIPTIALPLVTLPHMINSSLAVSLLSDLLPRLSHSNPNIRKKTIVSLYRLALVYPETLRHAWPKIKDSLMSEEEDSSVTAAIVNVVCELGWRRPRDFLPLAPRLFELLVDGGNNWMAIKIIKLVGHGFILMALKFATLTPLEPRLVKKLLPPLANLIRTTPAMSLLYECINGIIQGGILEGAEGVREGDDIAALCVGKLRGMIIVEGDPNLKYVALLAFKKIVLSHPDLVALHQDVIISCIDDHDISIRSQALELGAGMVNKDSLIDLVDRLIQQLRLTPAASTRADNSRADVLGVEPAADSDGEDPEQTLRISRDDQDGVLALPPEYRITTIRLILDMCAKDTYANISDFEWYINTLIQLVGLVPSISKPETQDERLGGQQRYISQTSNEEVSICIGRELCNIAVRVSSVRPETVQAAATLILSHEVHHSIRGFGSSASGALRFAVWIVGEYAEHLSDAESTLTAITHSRLGTLSSVAPCACLQAIPKVLVATIQKSSKVWTAEAQRKMSLLMARLLYFVEPLTTNSNFEVQERAVELAELIRVGSQAVKDHMTYSDHWPLFLTTAVPQLFGGSELNPVAPSAQTRIPLPNDLDLDVSLNSNLAELLQSTAEDLDTYPETMEFQTFYNQAPTRISEEARLGANKLPTSERETSSYPHTNISYSNGHLQDKKRFERRPKNKEDPFYIAGDEISSGTSTPFHEIISNTNDDGVDVDSIPIMNLDLGERFTNSYSEPEKSFQKKKKAPKDYRIAIDENVDIDDMSEPQTFPTAQARPIANIKGRTRGLIKRSLLEVDSSGLGGLALGDHSLDVPQPSTNREESGDVEMTRALQEVERLRLEMQRASERVQIADGLTTEGIMVKRKKKKTMKVKKREPQNDVVGSKEGDRPEQRRDGRPANSGGKLVIEEDAPVIKKKKRRKVDVTV